MATSRIQYCRLYLSIAVLLFVFCSCSCSSSSPLLGGSIDAFSGHTRISDFRVINRRLLFDCPDRNPQLAIDVSTNSPLPDEANITVTVSRVLDPDESDWVAMISPTGSRYVNFSTGWWVLISSVDVQYRFWFCFFWLNRACSSFTNSAKDCILNGFYYIQTGDLSNLPLLCHYPVKVRSVTSLDILD